VSTCETCGLSFVHAYSGEGTPDDVPDWQLVCWTPGDPSSPRGVHRKGACRVELVRQRDEAIRIARDLITWAKASDVSAGAVIDAQSRLDRLSQGRDAATEKE
jgi:hypothetical protein